jgi:hypothetical protein
MKNIGEKENKIKNNKYWGNKMLHLKKMGKNFLL